MFNLPQRTDFLYPRPMLPWIRKSRGCNVIFRKPLWRASSCSEPPLLNACKLLKPRSTPESSRATCSRPWAAIALPCVQEGTYHPSNRSLSSCAYPNSIYQALQAALHHLLLGRLSPRTLLKWTLLCNLLFWLPFATTLHLSCYKHRKRPSSTPPKTSPCPAPAGAQSIPGSTLHAAIGHPPRQYRSLYLVPQQTISHARGTAESLLITCPTVFFRSGGSSISCTYTDPIHSCYHCTWTAYGIKEQPNVSDFLSGTLCPCFFALLPVLVNTARLWATLAAPSLLRSVLVNLHVCGHHERVFVPRGSFVPLPLSLCPSRPCIHASRIVANQFVPLLGSLLPLACVTRCICFHFYMYILRWLFLKWLHKAARAGISSSGLAEHLCSAFSGPSHKPLAYSGSQDWCTFSGPKNWRAFSGPKDWCTFSPEPRCLLRPWTSLCLLRHAKSLCCWLLASYFPNSCLFEQKMSKCLSAKWMSKAITSVLRQQQRRSCWQWSTTTSIRISHLRKTSRWTLPLLLSTAFYPDRSSEPHIWLSEVGEVHSNPTVELPDDYG